VPAPPKDIDAPNTISSPLASPIHTHLNSLVQSHVNALTATLLERFDEVMKTERMEREEALKAALKVEREKREEALKVEREKRESEKADASERYELLKNHLLEVEETTLDTIGWLANDVSHRLLDKLNQ
jgi:isoaspartyl peptidase/L-asparaginase-like protein (Ntn-hydrolase superfamily)